MLPTGTPDTHLCTLSNTCGVLQYGAGGSTINQTNNPICDTKYYTKVQHFGNCLDFIAPVANHVFQVLPENGLN